MRTSRRSVLLGAAGLLTLLGGCGGRAATLAEVLSPARGRLLEGGPAGVADRIVDVDALLALARGRPVTLSFAYVGCAGGAPRLGAIERAVEGVAQGRPLHLVLDAVDPPGRLKEVERDVTGGAGPGPDALRLLFVRPDGLPESNPTARAIMAATGLRAGQERYLETVTGTGLFGSGGDLLGVYYG